MKIDHFGFMQMVAAVFSISAFGDQGGFQEFSQSQGGANQGAPAYYYHNQQMQPQNMMRQQAQSSPFSANGGVSQQVYQVQAYPQPTTNLAPQIYQQAQTQPPINPPFGGGFQNGSNPAAAAALSQQPRQVSPVQGLALAPAYYYNQQQLQRPTVTYQTPQFGGSAQFGINPGAAAAVNQQQQQQRAAFQGSVVAQPYSYNQLQPQVPTAIYPNSQLGGGAQNRQNVGAAAAVYQHSQAVNPFQGAGVAQTYSYNQQQPQVLNPIYPNSQFGGGVQNGINPGAAAAFYQHSQPGNPAQGAGVAQMYYYNQQQSPLPNVIHQNAPFGQQGIQPGGNVTPSMAYHYYNQQQVPNLNPLSNEPFNPNIPSTPKVTPGVFFYQKGDPSLNQNLTTAPSSTSSSGQTYSNSQPPAESNSSQPAYSSPSYSQNSSEGAQLNMAVPINTQRCFISPYTNQPVCE